MLVQTCHTRQTKRVTETVEWRGFVCLFVFLLVWFSPDIRLRHQQLWLGINLHPALHSATTRVSPVVRLTDSPPSGCPPWWDTCVLTNSCSPSERRRTSRQRHVRSARWMCECVQEGETGALGWREVVVVVWDLPSAEWAIRPPVGPTACRGRPAAASSPWSVERRLKVRWPLTDLGGRGGRLSLRCLTCPFVM